MPETTSEAGTMDPTEVPGPPRGSRRQRRRRPARRRLRLAVLVGAVAAVGFLVFAVVWFLGAVDEGPAGAREVVTLAPGSSTGSIVATLARRHVVSSDLAFRLYLLFHGDPTIDAGDYLLYDHQPFSSVLHRLAAGPDVFPVTVAVGTTVFELTGQVAQDVPRWSPGTFAAATTSGQVHSPWLPAGSTNFDGVLGTGTYLVMPGETPVQLLTQMVDRFDGQAAKANLANAAGADGVTPYQALIVASIVEKEGYYPKNFGGVARVIYNRLNAGMPLQMDATVLYALHQDGGPVTPADEQVPSPYNTYLNRGLPPTPICFPSAGALQAALHPPAGNWLYFELVSKSGTEAFESTYAQHLRDIALAHSRGLP